jgi:hypothetical protein
MYIKRFGKNLFQNAHCVKQLLNYVLSIYGKLYIFEQDKNSVSCMCHS